MTGEARLPVAEFPTSLIPCASTATLGDATPARSIYASAAADWS
jgi:hypothetical protein